MRRNTRGSKWVTTDVEHGRSGRRHPGKTVAFTTQQSAPAEVNVELSRGRSNSATSYEQPTSPILQAAIHDASDLERLPATHTRLPSVRSWSSFRSRLTNDEAISPRTVPFKKVQYDPGVSPLEHEGTPDWDASESYSDTEEVSAEDRKESNATMFPGAGVTIKKSEAKEADPRDVQGPPNLAGFFRAAKEIYNVGPKGEGQKLWSSYTGIRKGKHVYIEPKPLQQMSTTRRPSEGLSQHPPTASLPPEKQIETKERPLLLETLHPRKESDPSRTSYEVPIRMDHKNQQYVDRSKPLPPTPLLQPAPKRRQQGYAEIELKPLPLTPRTRSIPNASSQVDRDIVPRVPLVLRGSEGKSQKSNKTTKPTAQPKSVTNTAAQPHSASKGQKSAKPAKTKTPSKPSHWWTHLAALTSEDYHPSSSKPSTAPLKPKPTISRPRPITALEEGRTVNLAPSCGGVGGPGAVTPDCRHLSERGKGKGEGKVMYTSGSSSTPASPGMYMHGNKHKGWLERLGSPGESAVGGEGSASGSASGKKSRDRRRDSDLSFVCKGVEGRKRDTGFYGLYEEVLGEYEK